jgi:dynein heavy chain
MDVLECMIVAQSCKLLSGLLPPKDSRETLPRSHLEKIYVFALMWSFGAFLELDERKKLQEFLTHNDDFKLSVPYISSTNESDTIYDFYVGVEVDEWEHWSQRVEEYEYPKSHVPEYSSILVPNVDNIRTDYLISLIAKQNLATLLIGEQGTAKTVIIKSYMDKFNQEEHVQKTLNFSSATTPNGFQVD